jgi:hypothetical protein
VQVGKRDSEAVHEAFFLIIYFNLFWIKLIYSSVLHCYVISGITFNDDLNADTRVVKSLHCHRRTCNQTIYFFATIAESVVHQLLHCIHVFPIYMHTSQLVFNLNMYLAKQRMQSESIMIHLPFISK